MENCNGNGPTDNGHMVVRSSVYHSSCINLALSWLDIRVIYVRVSKYEIDDFTPDHLTLTHFPLVPETLLEINGVRSSTIYSDGMSTLLRRDRLDKKSEEATFVSTDSIRMTGSVKFEVFDKDVLLLSGVLELCSSNGFVGESDNNGRRWIMNFDSDVINGSSSSFLKEKQVLSQESASPTIEVYIAGSFLGSPIILTKSFQLSSRKKPTKKMMLEAIPEYEATLCPCTAYSYGLPTPRRVLQVSEYTNHEGENRDGYNMFTVGEYLGEEDEELSWFSAGVRVGVGIGLSICLGVGIGVGLLVRTYQGTTRNFRRRLL